MEIQPVTLEGRHVRLEPLTQSHFDALLEVALDPELWQWTLGTIGSREDLQRYLDTALGLEREGHALPFAIVTRHSGRAVGSTRFGSIDRTNCRVEIGWTWVGRAWQRTAVNTETKFLLLRHAFETLGCVRVEFKTDVLNEQSRTALVRIGAKEEGTLRRHIRTESGRWRDSVYYAIVDDDWPAVKRRLQAKLTQ
jgi:RimJ/RimL family protein N-acetyltransferase